MKSTSQSKGQRQYFVDRGRTGGATEIISEAQFAAELRRIGYNRAGVLKLMDSCERKALDLGVAFYWSVDDYTPRDRRRMVAARVAAGATITAIDEGGGGGECSLGAAS